MIVMGEENEHRHDMQPVQAGFDYDEYKFIVRLVCCTETGEDEDDCDVDEIIIVEARDV